MDLNWLQGSLQGSWRAAIEILILAVVIYYLLLFLRGTRGWSVVLGFLAVLLALVVITVLLQLQVLNLILANFFTFFAVAVLVIFQPELRRLLSELGNFQLFATTHEQRETIEVIVQACERLAEVRIGALIALERSINLREAVESGIAVDCQATPEMLETIFFPNNAIHDGGIIIKGDRIAYAACIFPLTRQQGLNASLGTRHRAAIGLSEETDAFVVAVSEETGAISCAFRGQLTRAITLEELRSQLSTVFIAHSPTRSLREWIRQHLVDRPRAAFSSEPPQTGNTEVH